MLPKLNQPEYLIHLYSIDRKVKYRPYTTGEEKILMMMARADDPEVVSLNLKKVISQCILDPTVNVDKLAAYDIEHLLIKLKAKSSGEILNLKYTDKDTGKTHKLDIDLDKLDVTFDPEHLYKIEITDTVGLIMQDLTFERVLQHQNITEQNQSHEEQVTLTFDIMMDCIKALYDEEKVYTIGEETSREELVEFINSISGITRKLYRFVETMPTVVHTTEIDGKPITIRNIKSFLE